MTAPMTAPIAPQPLTPPVPPWTPFQQRPNDAEPAVATIWLKKLSALMSTTKYAKQPKEWRECLDEWYQTEAQVMAQAQAAQMAAQGLPKGVSISEKADPSTIGQAEQAAVKGMSGAKPAGTQPTQATQPTQSAQPGVSG